MSHNHCAQCGAMSTLWSPACGFCGSPVSGTGMRTRSVIDVAFSGHPSDRREIKSRAGVRAGIRALWSRLFH